jgi:hypothetical protein
MDSHPQKQAEPGSKFGPGGDFLSFWPKEPTPSPKLEANTLTRLLYTIAEITNATLGSDFDSTLKIPTEAGQLSEHILYHEEKLKYAGQNGKADKSAYAPAASAATSNCLFSDEQMLLPDDCRTCSRTRRKPKHRIRTYRRTAKKTAAISLPEQGTLFEVNLQGAKTA